MCEITCIDCEDFETCKKEPCADDAVCDDFKPEQIKTDPSKRETNNK